MIVPIGALLLVLAPALLGGRLARLAGVRVRHTAVILVTLAVQVVAVELPLGPHWLPAAAHVATCLAAGVFIWLNRRIPGVLAIGLGAACNGVAIAVNAGTLPASRQALRLAGRLDQAKEFVNSGVVAHPRLGFLGDVFAIPDPWPLHNVFSVGDVIIILGAGYASLRICGARGLRPWVDGGRAARPWDGAASRLRPPIPTQVRRASTTPSQPAAASGTTAGPVARWRGSALRVLGACMVGLGLLIGLVFPVFLETLQIATPDRAESLAARLACVTAGVVVGGVNYVLARLVVGGRQRRLTGHLRRVDDIVRSATLTGDWSALVLHTCQIPVDSTDELGQTAEAFNALVSALDHNVAERRRLEARLHHQAFHDPLTGLANRALFADRLEHCLNRARRERTLPAVLYVDLDGFKAVNDTLGHAAGDTVLVEMSQRLLAGRRPTDTVARLGGDEFAILLEDVHPEHVTRVADQLQESLRAPMTLSGNRIQLGASIGVALADGRNTDPHAVLAEADTAMYRAKVQARAARGATGRVG